MTPWLWVSSLFASASEDEGDEEESLRLSALGFRALPTGSPSLLAGRQGRTLFEIFVDRQDEDEGLLYTVEISEGYVLRAYASYSEAQSNAESRVDEQLNMGEVDEVSIYCFEHVPDRLRMAALLHGVPYPEWRKRILDGQHDDFHDFGDGYEVSAALAPYLSTKIDPDYPSEPGLFWRWELTDLPFGDWPDRAKEEHRELVLRSSISQIPLRKGLLLHLRTTDPGPFEEVVGKRGALDEPVVVSTDRGSAPLDPICPQDHSKAVFVVVFEVKEEIPRDRVVVAPYKDEATTDQIGTVLGEDLNPRGRLLEDLEEVSKAANDQVEHFDVLLVETDEQGNAILFFDPGRVQLPIEVVSVERGG